jgi:hypothetical protein
LILKSLGLFSIHGMEKYFRTPNKNKGELGRKEKGQR